MPAPTITPLPTPPSRSDDPANFATEADAFIAALPAFVTGANAQASYLDTLAESVDADAAQVALDKNAAANSAAQAAQYTNAIAAYANFRGPYQAETSYYAGDSVSYNNFIWIALTSNTGVTPNDGANWSNLSIIDGGTF